MTRNTAREVDFFKESGKIGAILLRPATIAYAPPAWAAGACAAPNRNACRAGSFADDERYFRPRYISCSMSDLFILQAPLPELILRAAAAAEDGMTPDTLQSAKDISKRAG